MEEEKIEKSMEETETSAEQEEQASEPAEEKEEKATEQTTENLAELEEQIDKLKQQLKEKEDRLLRLQADFDNYRKRMRNEIANLEKYQSQALATDLLTSVDNFERALNTQVQAEEAKSLLQGMEMVYRGILEAFKNHGIEQIESVGKPFDPHYHHAVMQGNDDNVEKNVVLEEFQKGYIMKDRVIRPAMVKVNE
ncbi:nucleotide exchange factor GrpE [Fervidibacillus albus]|uniref:Protein GrpE n=2 Tax=Fervidibacillus albus TaxID=2980026 RepID=A0A9E8LX03_9BACI|nr:nucleotide exchange factor GrpE [Fervidibacillus albus]WAA11215.1 nucleotide exchange factor GrpE [Fervidibacillus albus]